MQDATSQERLLCLQVGKQLAQKVGLWQRGALQDPVHALGERRCTLRYRQAMLEQQAAHLIAQRRTPSHAALPDEMHRLHGQGLQAFHRHGVDGLIASGVAIVLGATAVIGDTLCRQSGIPVWPGR